MEKIRIYELAKELNTTSKRLIEKLSEINISVKNHMSILEEQELKALYKHIGVIQQDNSETAEEKKAVQTQPKAESKRTNKNTRRNAPRIIRTTEIRVDSDKKERPIPPNAKTTGTRGGRYNNTRRDYVKVADDNSGLRAGFVRDTGYDSIMELVSSNKKRSAKSHESEDKKAGKAEKTEKPAVKEVKKDTKPGIKEDTQKEPAKQEVKLEQKEKLKQETKDIQKPVKTVEQTTKEKREDRKEKVLSEQETSDVIATRKTTEDSTKTDDKSKKHDNKEQYESINKKQDEQKHKKDEDKEERPKRGGKQVMRTLEIPKVELTEAQKEELNAQRTGAKRDFVEKDDKNLIRSEKRISKKDLLSSQGTRSRKIKAQTLIFNDKKGLSEILTEDFIYDELLDDGKENKKTKKSHKSKKGSKVNVAKSDKPKHIPHRAVLTSVTIPESITVKDFAETLKKTSTEVIKKLMSLGLMVTINQEIDFDTAAIIADEFNIKVEKEVVVNEEDILFDEGEEDENKLKPRPPVVVVMGHVDHGKTSLLDAIRKGNTTESEAGGITQHIGAYTVKINNRNITFLDTPGHEAFTSMRARGAQVTDIAILVVAADDGIMPQTIEAINHAKAANVSIIVAINKIDKPTANPERVKQELTEHGLLVEEWGGDVIAVPVSAKNRTNIDQLLEMVLLTADILELKANPDRQAKGTIIEAKLDKNRGPLATLLVQRGTLNVGDTILTGTIMGRIRAMVDDKGNSIDSAGPSTPVEILGLPEVPEAGEIFYVITDEKVAKSLIEKRKNRQREEQLKSTAKISLDDLYNQIQEGEVKDLNIIVKADVQGSVEAVKQSLMKLGNEEVRINIIHGGVGAVTESDVTLASVSNAIIIGFNVRPRPNVMELAEDEKVDIRLYRVIYEAIEDIEQAMKGMLEPTFKETVLGHAEIRQIFKASGVGTIGGAYVLDGKILRNSSVRLVRDGIVVFEGKLASLKRFKDDVREVHQGFECGLSIERFNDIKEGDILESFIMEEVKRD